MEELLRQISDKFMVFHAAAWGQVEQLESRSGIDCAIKSRTAAMELGAKLKEWRKLSLENQVDSIDLP